MAFPFAPSWFRVILCTVASLLAIGPTRAAAPVEPQITEGFINAPLAEVWRVFTTAEGLLTTGVDKADVDLRIGGSIRTISGGAGGTWVSEVLAFEPERMLALRTREAPTGFPHRDAMVGTWTIIYFTPSGQDMTHVRFVALGYTDAPASQALRKFSADAHRQTLDRVAQRYWPKCKLCQTESPVAPAQ